MPSRIAGADAVVVGIAAAVVVLVILGTVISRHSVHRRVAAAATRLGAADTRLVQGRGLERGLVALDDAVEAHVAALTEAELHASRLGAALAAVPQGVVICDGSGAVRFRNEFAESFVNARHAEALVEQAIDEQLQAALAGRPDRRSIEVYGPPRRALVIMSMPLDDGALCIIEDVSERRRLEAVRRDFVANISHELKTPVGALGLLAETLAEERSPEVSARLARRLQDEALRVGRIIDDLLDLSRIEAEEAPSREPVPVHLVVAEAVDRVRSLAERQQVTVDVEEISERQTIRGDRRQLVSAVANLLENAVKYSDPGGVVAVRSHTDGTWVELAVRDDGVGIPSRDLERIFERFYRVDRARSRETGGTGLGLAIVRHVAQNHRGEVRVESREGEGSTFTLRLPAGPGPVAVTRAEAG